MLIIEHTVETTASPAAIWNIWQDVENWNTWDAGIEYSRLDGPFQTGTTGILKPKEGPLVKTKLTGVEPLKGFSDEAENAHHPPDRNERAARFSLRLSDRKGDEKKSPKRDDVPR